MTVTLGTVKDELGTAVIPNIRGYVFFHIMYDVLLTMYPHGAVYQHTSADSLHWYFGALVHCVLTMHSAVYCVLRDCTVNKNNWYLAHRTVQVTGTVCR